MNLEEPTFFANSPLGRALAQLHRPQGLKLPAFLAWLQAYARHPLWQWGEGFEGGSVTPLLPLLGTAAPLPTIRLSEPEIWLKKQVGLVSGQRGKLESDVPVLAAGPQTALVEPSRVIFKGKGFAWHSPPPLKAKQHRNRRAYQQPLGLQLTLGTLAPTRDAFLLPSRLIRSVNRLKPRRENSPPALNRIPKTSSSQRHLQRSAAAPQARIDFMLPSPAPWSLLKSFVSLSGKLGPMQFEPQGLKNPPPQQGSKKPAQPREAQRPVLSNDVQLPGIGTLKRLHRWAQKEDTPLTDLKPPQRPLLKAHRRSPAAATKPAAAPKTQVIHHRPTQHLHQHGALSPKELAGFK